MQISDFKVGQIYTRNELMGAFLGAFQGGINICKRTKTIVITSVHTGNRIYDDKLFDGDVMYYTGEGQLGDQKMWKGNKAILKAKENGFTIHLFVRFKKPEYTYYGTVCLVDEPFYADEKDVLGNVRKVIKFPIMRCSGIRPLTNFESSNIIAGGALPSDNPTYNVVGAAIVNDKDELLCAQRSKGELIGKWEFPGGKIEEGETEEDALKREIKEELDIDIEVLEKVDENYYQYEKCNVLLKVYKCKYVSGEIKKIEHQQIKWVKFEEIEDLEWAEADAPIVDTFLDSIPAKIISQLDVDYDNAEKIVPSNKEIKRALQDHERKLKNQKKSGDLAEDAVMVYERDRLNNLGHPDLAEKIEQISKVNEAAGYDIKSFDVSNTGVIFEKHIEVKSAKMGSDYIEFFISENELQKFKNEKIHFIYCCIKCGRKYKLHIVDKENFFKDEYTSPIAYKVKIKIKL